MNISQQIEQLKQNILSGMDTDKQKEVDMLIELEGMKSMDFFQSIFLKDPFHEEEGTLELHNVAGYGVRQLIELGARESKSDFRFCPFCASELSEYKIPDLYMIGLKCTNDHCFHIEVQQGECKDKKLYVDKHTTIAIAKEWLTNQNFRKEIQNQVAEILRKYITLKNSGDNQEDETQSNNFCPICRLSLEEFKQNDVWVQGLKCSNNHIFYERNGLSYKLSNLKPDITKASFDFLVTSYLKSEQREHLPDQIVILLRSIVEERK